jgi:hypothetical protein
MPIRWKLVGLAGLAGVAATGVAVARNRRPQTAYTPEELRDRLRHRLAEAQGPPNGAVRPVPADPSGS